MQFKKNQNKIYKFLLITFLFIASIVAMVFGSINIGKNNTQKGAFGDSFFMSFQLDISNANNKEEQISMLKSSSESFTNWLLSQNVNVKSVEYELKEGTDIKSNLGYIYTERLNVNTIEYQGEKKVNQNPTFIALDSYNSSRLEIQQYNPEGTDTKIPKTLGSYTNNNLMYSSVITQDHIDLNTVVKDSRSKLATNNATTNYGVTFNIKNSDPLSIDKFNEQKEASSTTKLEWIVFQDIDGLVSKLRYAKYLGLRVKNNPTENELFNFNTLPTEYQTWASAASTGTGSNDPITRDNLLYYYKMAASSSSSESSSTTRASAEANGDSSLKTIVDKNILGTITYDNYNDWFPDSVVIGSNKDDGSTDNGDSNNNNNNEKSLNANTVSPRAGGTPLITKISLQSSTTEQQQTDLINRLKTMVVSAPLYINNALTARQYPFSGSAWINKSFLNSGTVGLDAYESTMLSLGIVVIMIAIIVSVLYRIPGIFGAFAIIASSVFSASLLVVLNINFSISTIVGLLVGILCCTMSVCLFVERMRKSFKDRHSVFDSLMNTFKKSLFTIIDINVLPLLLGLGLVFVGKGEIIDFGLVLILVSLVTIASVAIYYILPNFLIRDNTWLWNPKLYLWFNSNKNYSYNFEKINKFGIKYKKIIFPTFITIAFLLFLIGLILVLITGVHNSSYYNIATTVLINTNVANGVTGDIVHNPDYVLSLLPGGKWEYIGVSNGVYNFRVTGNISANDIYASLASIVNQHAVSVLINDPSYAINTSLSGLYAILLGYGFIAVYAVFRLNLLSVLPWFIVSCLGTLAPISIIYLVWIPIDSLFIYSCIFISIVSALTSFMYISITKTRFNKRQISKVDELTSFISLNIINIKNLVIIFAFVILIFSLVFIGFGSYSMMWLFVYILIGSVLSIIFNYILIPFMYFVSLYIRQRYVKNIVANVDKRINLKQDDDVDEELIEGINKFH